MQDECKSGLTRIILNVSSVRSSKHDDASLSLRSVSYTCRDNAPVLHAGDIRIKFSPGNKLSSLYAFVLLVSLSLQANDKVAAYLEMGHNFLKRFFILHSKLHKLFIWNSVSK